MGLQGNIKELRQATATKLIESSKSVHAAYRSHTKIVKEIYEWAKAILDEVFYEQEYSLPIDVRMVAAKLGFSISVEDFSEVEKQYYINGHDSLPIAQLKMRQKLFGADSETICGTIHLANYLSENSIRFSIAHELGHFALREHNPIGSSLVLEACPGLYPMTDTDEMLADLFAYALLLPQHLFENERKKYESDRTHWPLDYPEWIKYIRDKAQIPEYYAVLACQEIKKCGIYEECRYAEECLDQKLSSFDIFKPEDWKAARHLYSITINNLESWGFSRDQVAAIVFGETTNTSREVKRENRSIIAIMHDHYILNQELQMWKDKKGTEHEYQLQFNMSDTFDKLKSHIVKHLQIYADLSTDGISEITTIPVEKVRELLAYPSDADV